VSLPVNYLEAEGFIIKALKDGLMQAGSGIVRNVFGMHDLSRIKESEQFAPAVYVVYGGDKPAHIDGVGISDEYRFTFVQQWLVIVCVKTAETQAALATPKHDIAGPIISKVLGLLFGKQPSKMHTPFKRGASLLPYFDASYGHYPLVFETDVGGCIDDNY
jgi:hypothetical protein